MTARNKYKAAISTENSLEPLSSISSHEDDDVVNDDEELACFMSTQ